MQRSMAWLSLLGCVFCGCLQTQADGTFTLTDSGSSSVTRTFTNSVGTAATTNGTMIVFEGQLDSNLSVTKLYNAESGKDLATVQFLVQVKLFDELPASNEVGTAQGAVVALRNSALSTNGTYYAWGVTNSVAAWVQVLSTNGVPFAVNDGETNYITFVFAYPHSGSGTVTYQIFVGDVGAAGMAPSEAITTAVSAATSGINSVSLLGSGVLQEVGTASGSPAPLSTSISLSVYCSSNSIWADVYTVNENGSSPIKIYAFINGDWVLVGTVDSVYGDGDSHKYHVLLSGLVAGNSYLFKIVDESSHVHVLSGALTVETIRVGGVSLETATVNEMTMQTLVVTFNTVTGNKYLVKVASSLTATDGEWALEYVSQNRGGVWGDYSTNAFTSVSDQTQIRVPINKDKAFFRIFKVEE